MITPERIRIWRDLIRGGKKTFPASGIVELLDERGAIAALIEDLEAEAAAHQQAAQAARECDPLDYCGHSGRSRVLYDVAARLRKLLGAEPRPGARIINLSKED